jgi:hypothetical protein
VAFFKLFEPRKATLDRDEYLGGIVLAAQPNVLDALYPGHLRI